MSFIIEDWNAIVGNQETPGVTAKYGLGIRNEAGQYSSFPLFEISLQIELFLC